MSVANPQVRGRWNSLGATQKRSKTPAKAGEVPHIQILCVLTLSHRDLSLGVGASCASPLWAVLGWLQLPPVTSVSPAVSVTPKTSRVPSLPCPFLRRHLPPSCWFAPAGPCVSSAVGVLPTSRGNHGILEWCGHPLVCFP